MSAYGNLALMTESVTQLISVGGTELPHSRRYVDLLQCSSAFCQFKSSAGISVRLEYSSDEGVNWATLVDESNFVGGNPYSKEWTAIPDDAKQNRVLIRALAIGIGILTTVNFVDVGFQ